MLYVSRYLLQYQGSVVPNRYNKFSRANLCHVCKEADRDHLITCDQCHMISYCSLLHKMLHQEEHIKICHALKRLYEEDPQWRARRMNHNDWVQSRKVLLATIENEVRRELQLYEQEMILRPKSCFICYQQVRLQTCHMCCSDNYCTDHAREFEVFHVVSCKELMICVNLNIRFLESPPESFADQLSMRIGEFANENRSFTDMDSLINNYMLRKREYIGLEEWFYENYIYSEVITCPFTLYYGMQSENLLHHLETENGICVIHILSGTKADKYYLTAWEFFLHLLYIT